MPTPPDSDHAARLARLAATVATTPTPLAMPTIHPNGSGAAHLTAAYGAVVVALNEAMDLAMQKAPNARDYDEATYRLARAQHDARLALLGKVRDEYIALRYHCRTAMQERT